MKGQDTNKIWRFFDRERCFWRIKVDTATQILASILLIYETVSFVFNSHQHITHTPMYLFDLFFDIILSILILAVKEVLFTFVAIILLLYGSLYKKFQFHMPYIAYGMLELILDIILAFYTTFTFLIGPERRYRTWNLDDYKALLALVGKTVLPIVWNLYILSIVVRDYLHLKFELLCKLEKPSVEDEKPILEEVV